MAEAPEKPGNIGGLTPYGRRCKYRCCDHCQSTDRLYTTPISFGRVLADCLQCPFATGTSEDVIAYLKQHKIAIYSAILQESVPYDSINFKTRLCPRGWYGIHGTESNMGAPNPRLIFRFQWKEKLIQ